MGYPSEHSASAALFKRARAVMPGGNSRHSIAFPPYPVYAVSGQGCTITDADGKTRIDCINNMSANIHGHRHPVIEEAVAAQQSKLVSLGLPTQVEIELAELMCARVPSVERIRFCNSGTEALMFAARAARAFTGRNKIAKIEGGYHGSYDGLDLSNKPGPAQWGDGDAPATVIEGAGITQNSADQTVILQANRVEATRAVIERHGDDLAAVFIDPLVSRMGFLPLDQAYLEMIREETAKRGIVLIFDEVFSFRLGRAGAQGAFGVTPDLSTFGKIIGGGYPIGAFGGRADVMDVFNHLRDGGPVVQHSGTFFANPISMAAGHAALILLDDATFDHLAQLGDALRDGLRALIQELGIAGQVMGQGSLVAFMPHAAPYKDYRAFATGMGPDAAALGHQFHTMLENGVLPVFPRGFILSSPMTMDTIDHILAATKTAVKSTLEQKAA